MAEAALVAHEVQVSVRLPQSFVDRAEKLAARLRQNPDNALMGMTRATVLRLAIARGLTALEAETGGEPSADDRPSRPAKKR